MSQRKRSNFKGKTKDVELFSVAAPTASDTFDKLKTRHKTYERVSYVFKPKKDKRRRTEEEEDSSVPVSPYRTTSTEAIDTEEGQEITRFIKEKAYQRQRALTLQKVKAGGPIYDLPRPLSIPVPEPEDNWSRSFERTTSAQAVTSTPQYEELGIKNRSLTQTPKYFDQTQEILSTVKKVPLQTGPSAFVSYRQAVLDTLDQRTPRTRSRAKRSLSETIVPPMVHGITPEESSSDQGRTQSQSKFEVYVPMTQSIVRGTDGNKISQIPTCTAVELLTQFTQTIQGDSVITVPTMTLVSDKVRTSTLLKPIEPDFYLPGGVRLSEVKTYKIEELSPDGNPAVMIRLSSLKAVYNTDMFMLDKYSGHLFVTDEDGVYMKAQEKGWIFPTESTIEEPLAGNIPHPGSITPQSIQLNNFKKTPEAESTRDQIPTTTPPRTIREILDQKSGKSPQLKGSRESTPKPKTVAQLLVEKRVQQQTQLAQEIEYEQRIKEEQEQIRKDKEEARLIQEERERANRERMIVEGERLRLQAQQAAIERNKKLELERIEREKQERLEQHRKAEFAMKELEEKEKQAAEFAKKVQEKEIETKVDSLVEQELQSLRSKVTSPEISTIQTNKQAKQDITTLMPKYPSTETLDKCDTRELNRRQRMYYQEKELILTEKLALAENAYFTRESVDMTLEQAQLNHLEYDNMKRDLEEKRKYCFQMLLLPNQEIPKYPTPPSVKTPPSELDEEQVNYYLDKSEEL